jgi:hypothetical protein
VATRTLLATRFGFAEHHSRSHNAVMRVYDDAGDVIATQEHKGEFKTGERHHLFCLISKIVLDLNPRFSLRSI